MVSANTLVLCLLLAAPGNDGWEVAKKTDHLTVFAREREGSQVREMRAVGELDVPPQRVWQALRDYASYTRTMPYTEESRVLGREEGEKITYLYSVVKAPLVDRRDYAIRLVDESRWQDGKGYLKVSWTIANGKAPPKAEGVVRVQVNEGHWLLEPLDGGKRTRATYYVHTDPGGSVPRWLANKANGTAVPNVFEHVRQAALAGK